METKHKYRVGDKVWRYVTNESSKKINYGTITKLTYSKSNKELLAYEITNTKHKNMNQEIWWEEYIMGTVKVDTSILKEGMKVNLYSKEEMDQLYTLVPGTAIINYKEFIMGIVDSQFNYKQATIRSINKDYFMIEEDIRLLFPIEMIKSIVNNTDNTDDWDDLPGTSQDEAAEQGEIKAGDVVKAINTSSGNAIIEGHYYLVKSIKRNMVNLELDSKGSVGNEWNINNFIKVKSEKLNNPNDGKVIAIKTALVPDIVKGKQYQLNNGYILDDDPFGVKLKEKNYPLFRRILDEFPSQNQNNEIPDIEIDESPIEKPAMTPIKYTDIDIKEECKIMKPYPILLEGPVSSGKTTILMELAQELNIPYYAAVLNDQTSKTEFTGYKNAMNGETVLTEFRKAFEFGGLFSLEELNACPANLTIIFNTITNGFFVFADKIVYAHKDFWLCATMNTITNAKDFGGRRRLDASVLDRFHRIIVNRNFKDRIDPETQEYIKRIEREFEKQGITKEISVRDAQRFEHLLKNSKITTETAIIKCFIQDRIKISDSTMRYFITGVHI